jgi:hypothetical protein
LLPLGAGKTGITKRVFQQEKVLAANERNLRILIRFSARLEAAILPNDLKADDTDALSRIIFLNL